MVYNMKIPLLFGLCSVLCWSEQVTADFDHEVKRGVYPFMAVVYYPDEAIVDSTGARFQRGAVLIRNKWLLSSAIDHSVLDNVPLGFPRKTMLARLGAISLDANFTLNEDEDEQENEVIQVVRPSNHNPEKWWLTDITLLQTLLPFKITSAVATTSISFKSGFDKSCIILVFSKRFGNVTEDKVLMQLAVELLPASNDNCGTKFSDTTMTCAVDSSETKNAGVDPEFCQGNGGGPLMCEGEVIALQTYIDNNCEQPHLYQLLNSWGSFVNCGVEEKCGSDSSCNNCVAVNKDTPIIETTSSVFTTIYEDINTTITPTTVIFTDESDVSTVVITQVTEQAQTEQQQTEHPQTEQPQTEHPQTEQPQTEQPQTEHPQTEHSSTFPPATEQPEIVTTEKVTEPTTKSTTMETTTVITTTTTIASTKSWPIERTLPESELSTEPLENLTRKPKLEAQQQQLKTVRQPTQYRGSANRYDNVMEILLIPLLILAYFV